MTSTTSPRLYLGNRHAPLPRSDGAGPLARVLAWDARFRMRRALAELPEARLADAGLSRDEALTEASKPFWRL